jgi:manganese-dependent ADP-ribose/CDP-alcohol diphosphatase
MQDETRHPLAVFGIVADVQYADIDDFQAKNRIRYYRTSFDRLENALKDWSSSGVGVVGHKLNFILQLGDLIEASRTSDYYEPRLRRVLKLLDERADCELFHIWGNHEAHAIKREGLLASPLHTAHRLNQAPQGRRSANYYFHDITAKLRLVCLDQYEISVLGYGVDDREFKMAVEILEKNRSIETSDKAEQERLERFKIHNGAMSEEQFVWLENQLKFCRDAKKRVLLCGHVPLLVEAAIADGVAWDAEKILQLIWSFDDLVVAYLAGHYHPGGYAVDKNKIHHLTLNSILETSMNENNSYATAFVYDDRFILKNNFSPSASFTVDL